MFDLWSWHSVSERRVCKCEHLRMYPVPFLCPYHHGPSMYTVGITEIERKWGQTASEMGGNLGMIYEWQTWGLVRLWHVVYYKLDSGQAWNEILCLSSVFSTPTYDLVSAFGWSDDECAFENNRVLDIWNKSAWRTGHMCSKSCFSPV